MANWPKHFSFNFIVTPYRSLTIINSQNIMKFRKTQSYQKNSYWRNKFKIKGIPPRIRISLALSTSLQSRFKVQITCHRRVHCSPSLSTLSSTGRESYIITYKYCHIISTEHTDNLKLVVEVNLKQVRTLKYE